MVLNIPGNNIQQGRTVVSYKGAGAPAKTGLHRYVFVVYKQKAKIDKAFPQLDDDHRQNFDVEKFASENGLGTPVFGNFYQAKHED
jgi:phosphatidylethanolamine-binding protein (PEBP) family uncharacterized protein